MPLSRIHRRYPTTTTRWSHPAKEEVSDRPPTLKQPTPILEQALSDWTRQARVPLVAAATAAMLCAGTIGNPLPADAAVSGGRMGGSFSRSPSRSSYSGGGRSSFSGSGRSYYAAPRTTIVAPIVTPFYNPFYAPPIVPFYGGGVGAISYARGPGLFDLLFLGGIGFLALSAVSNALSPRSNQWDDDNGGVSLSAASAGTTVLRLNVALDVANRDDPSSILSVLDRIANTTGKKTSTRAGVQQLTKQVALELLRRKSSMSSAFGQVQYCKEERQGQRVFNEWSVRERSKFEKETINRFGGVDFSMPRRAKSDNDSVASSKATMAVVTLVLSLEESLPKGMSIQSLDDVERILRQVASSEGAVLGAEILWTPEDRSEVLTRKEVLADYPELRAL